LFKKKHFRLRSDPMTSDAPNTPTEDLTPPAILPEADITESDPPAIPVTKLQLDDPSEATLAAPSETPALPETPAKPPEAVSPSKNQTIQVRFKTEHGKLLLILPAEQITAGSGPLSYSWTEVLDQLKQRLTTESRSWPAQTSLYVVARDRLLTVQHLQELADILQTARLQIRRIYTSRRQTAIAGVTAGYCVDQQIAPETASTNAAEATTTAMAEPLVLRTTLRSGVEIRHNGTVVVMGDLNPGSSIVATGDILVWGRLRGNAHAGAKGNGRSRIMALQMEPAQIRIADFVARGPSTTPQQFFPEVAYVNPQGRISIARASELAKNETAIGLKMPATGRVFSQS
jgi:septum site-determining protein MinC